MTGTLPPMLDSVVGGGTPGKKLFYTLMNPMLLCPVSTSSSSTQAHLLPSTCAKIPTIQSASLLPIPIPTTTIPNNNLNTSASSLETETRPLTTSNKFAALSTEIQPLVPLTRICPY
ncbi:hypothetical protein TNCV_399181 [Trichonephila clavipes]|nr:hypothetical protein TNCV_399181 [Trichonephila clavipes]